MGNIKLTIVFGVFLFGLECYVLDVKYLELIKLRQVGSSIYPLLATCTYIVVTWLLTLLYIYISLNLKLFSRLIAWFMFCLSTVVQYSYKSTFGEFASPKDLKIAFYMVDMELWKEAGISFFNPIALIPCIFYALILVISKGSNSWSIKKFILIPSLLIASSIGLYINGGANYPLENLPTSSFVSIYNSLVFLSINQINEQQYIRLPIEPISKDKPQKNIIIIMDESVRGDRLSINGYHRKTTPYLENLLKKGKLINWGVATSCATGSVSSNALFLTGVNSFPDTNHNILTNPTIFQFSRAMGYKNWYFDAQKEDWWNGSTSDFKLIDHFVPLRKIKDNNNTPQYDYDMLVANQIRKIVSESTGNFIFITKRGVHFIYNDDFKYETAEWQPIMTSAQIDTSRKYEMTNSYDNALHYNSEIFFKALFKDDSIPANSFFIYTSDHGETLSENSETWSHSRNTKNEAKVPLIFFGSALPSCNTSYPASHFNLFATLLDMMEVPHEYRKYNYSPSLFKINKDSFQKRFYMEGSLYGLDHTYPLWFD